MKLRSLISAVAISTLLASAAYADDTAIKVPTMVCQMCVDAITKAAKSVDGVSEVKIDKEKKIATVTYKGDKETVTKIEKAISKAGYQANDVKADPDAFAKLPGCCQAK